MASIHRPVRRPRGSPGPTQRVDTDLEMEHLLEEVLRREPAPLPYAGVIEDDPDLSLRIEELLTRTGG